MDGAKAARTRLAGRLTAAPAALLAATAALLILATTAWAFGELSQKPGTEGCISDSGTGGACRQAPGLNGANNVAVSPDSKNVYVAAYDSSAVTVFNRDAVSGGLTPAGCISQLAIPGCTAGVGLTGVVGIVVSPDGKNVYTSSGAVDTVAIFDRDLTSGALTQKAGPAGCVSETGSGGACIDGVGLDTPYGLAISPDGNTVYTASDDSGGVSVLSRNTTTGTLAPAGCLTHDGYRRLPPGERPQRRLPRHRQPGQQERLRRRQCARDPRPEPRDRRGAGEAWHGGLRVEHRACRHLPHGPRSHGLPVGRGRERGWQERLPGNGDSRRGSDLRP